MVYFLPRIGRINLIIWLVFVAITNIDCRLGGRGKAGRARISKLIKDKFHSNTINGQSSFIRKSNNHILVSGGDVGLLVGTLALRSFVSNNNKASIQSHQILTNGTGSLCINRENYSNFIFNEFHCPLSPIFTVNNRYCCGPFHQQYCCSFWESDSRTIGAIIGIILACSLFVLFIISCIIYYRRYLKQNGKGFSGGRGGGGFKGGSKGTGTFGGSSSYNRPNSYGNNMGKPRSGSSFKSNAMSFAAGAAGGIAAYSIMRSMSGSYRSRPDGYYGPGYGVGETCTNTEDLNGTVFGEFRCPLYGFPQEAKYCCGEYGQQFCCIREGSSRFSRGASHFGWIVLVIVILLILILIWARRNRQRQKELMMVPTEPPANEQYRAPPFYQPPPPASGYPPPPNQNPYAFPQQNQQGNFNPYTQQSHTPYPPQQQPFNPY